MKPITRILSIFLCFCILFTSFPANMLAYYAEKPEGLNIIDKNGNTITTNKGWETTFPYGTFAFSTNELTVKEGGEGKITVYRLGGTKGRATAYITYVPAVAEIEAGVKTYANAAGSQDVIIRVEDPLPIAAYQPVGKEPDPSKPEPAVKVLQAVSENTGNESSSNGTTETDPAVKDICLTLDFIEIANKVYAYQWYIHSNGNWELVKGASSRDFIVSEKDFTSYDFRCVYTVDGISYCSDSAKGLAYVMPEQEVLPQIPENLELSPKPSYTILPMNNPDIYAGYIFELTFAENEWVKEIYISSAEDAKAEPDKFGMFTIVDCLGGSLYDTANTLMCRIADNEALEPSQIGFAVTGITVDKSAGSALLSVKRTGGTQNVLTVSYTTSDGTAISGKDYTAISGSLMFYADITEQTIEIPLIDDGLATKEQVFFTVAISDLKGDQAGICTLTQTSAIISLYNTATSKNPNLATILYDAEAIDISGRVREENTAIAPVAEAITGQEVENTSELLVGTLVSDNADEIGPLTYNYPNKLSFPSGGWRDWVYVANNGGAYNYLGINNTDGYATTPWAGGSSYGSGWKVESSGTASAYLNIPYMNQLYDRFVGRFTWRAAIGSSLYDLEYTYPWFQILRSNFTSFYYKDSPSWGEGDFWSGTKIWWYPSGYGDKSWSMSDNVQYLMLGLSRYDCHDANSAALAAIEDGALHRRVFSNKLALRIHTANDSGSGYNGIKTSPDGAASLTEASGIYNSMIPSIAVVSNHGGVNSSGNVYVGSQLQVTCQSTPSYVPAKDDSSLSYAVYLTNSSGGIVASSTSTGNVHNLTMRWDSLTDAGLNDQYTLNVVMTRKQVLKLDLSPSVERMTDANGNVLPEIKTTTSAINASKNLFWGRTSGITYGYSSVGSAPPHFSYSGSNIRTLTAASFSSTSTSTADDAILSASDIKNLQWINFNLPAEDVVLYNGRAYAGNEQIWLSVSDLAMANMTFRYYNKDYLTAPSIMTTDISQTGLFLDGNGNGRIDGWFNEYTGYFILDPASGDELLFYMEPGVDYDENVFAPVPVFGKDAGGNTIITGYRQYFLKSVYTMTPRCLTVPEGSTSSDAAQVMPAFVADITDSATLASLTDEQQAYRYVVSGLNRAYAPVGGDLNSITINDIDYARSADNHLMYGSVANKPSCIDIPLGGDRSPAKLSTDGKTFIWSPDYHGNLLYNFPSPGPISIPHSLAGDNIPVAAVESINPTTGAVTFTGNQAAAVAKLNGFLGSFTSNDTYSLCVQEQKYTTAEIAAANGISIPGMGLMAATDQPDPESIRLAGSGCFPNSDYLKQNNQAAGTTEPNMDMSGSGNEYPEFNLDLGVKLPSTDIGVTDYVTILMDEYEIGFSIGLPIGGYNSNGDAGSGGVGGDGSGNGWYGPKKANASNAEDMGKLRDFLKSPSKDTFKATDDSYSDAKDKGKMKSSSFSVEFSISLAFLWKYNNIDNAYYFSQFSVAVAAELEFKYQYRLTPCPIVYVYVTVGISVEIGTGMTVDRDAVEETGILLPETQQFTLKKGYTYTIPTTVKAFNITFDGKLYMELFDDYIPASGSAQASWTNPISDFNKGYIKSEGDEPVTVTLLKQDGTELKNDNGNTATNFVRLTALEDTTITRVARIVDVRSDVYWNGFSIEPEAFIEAGAGIGVEICKFEVFIKVNIGCKMTLGKYDKETKSYEPFEFEEFEFGLGLGFRVVLLVFSYEMDLISYKITYDVTRPEGGRWVHSWSALGGLYGGDIGTLTAIDSNGNRLPVHIKLPKSTAQTQTIYTPPVSGGISTQAYDATDAQVPFQLSGYGSSGDAFKLVDGLVTGYDYKVVTVGQDNYLIYTIGRSADNEVDYTMLVMSRLKLTKAASSSTGKDNYGLVHPVTGAAGGYLILDSDGTGDLGFDAWVDGNVINAAWVSYASVSAAAPARLGIPDAAVYPVPVSSGAPSVQMNQTNYKNISLFPVPALPTLPVAPTSPVLPRPVPEATQPATPKPTAAPDPTNTTKYPGGDKDPNYISDLASYNLLIAAWNAWELEQAWDVYDSSYQTYLGAKAAYDSVKMKLDAYMAWYAYFDVNMYYQTRAANAAKNTVIKKASFLVKDIYSGDETFTPAQIISGINTADSMPVTGSHTFLPDSAGNGNAVFFSRAIHYTDAEESAAASAYNGYLAAAYPVADASASIREYRALYQKGLRDAYGKGTTLNASVNGAIAAGSPTLAAGQTLENMEVMFAGSGIYYLAYTTNQQTIVYSNPPVNTAPYDLLTIRRIYLRKVTVNADNTVTWGSPYLLRTLKDYDLNKAGVDGVYSASSATVNTPYAEPYFSNLQFLYGKLGTLANGEVATLAEISPQNFLLFEMNGSTYIIPEAQLNTITTTGAGTLYPFFKPEIYNNPDGTTATASTSGRTEVTIGADGAGNISAVYVGAVPNTGNNALYLTKYDPSTNTWGSGTMLAMNYMQEYEDTIGNDWTAEQAEAAYLGRRPDGLSGGGMDQFKFSGLQIALGQKNAAAPSASLGVNLLSEEPVSASSDPVDSKLAAQYGLTNNLSLLDTNQRESLISGLTEEQFTALAGEPISTQDTLLVITQGSMTYLKERTVGGGATGETIITPMSDEEASAKYLVDTASGGYYSNRKPGVGFYAISYGVGGQRIGEDSLTFVDYNFSTGSKLKSTVSFVNAGDITIRGSIADPVTVELCVITPAGSDTLLNTWVVAQNIAAGQKVTLYGNADALSGTLPTGSIFYIKVYEDMEYITSTGGTPFLASTLVKDAVGTPVSGTFTVAEKPELGFEHCVIKPIGVDVSGNTILEVDYQVGNRGNKMAQDVYVQFTYESGKDSNGKPVFLPLNLTGHHLTVSMQETLKTLDASSSAELVNGILRLYNSADGDNIDVNKGRTVTGTITVPPSCYKGSITDSLNLNLEIFSGTDTITAMNVGVVTAKHDEYYSVNNAEANQIEHTTYFTVADKVTLAMGNTMRLPVSIATTTGQAPQIKVAEIPDGNDGKRNLGVLYYSSDNNYANGHSTGTLVIAPSGEGSGIIHLMDTLTNSIYAIAYSVTAYTEGINIFRDNSIFTFINANGSQYDPDLTNQSWEFRSSIPEWGAGAASDMPYLSNLAYGDMNASFSFRTVAQSMDLYFNGTATVTSTLYDTSVTVTASGGTTKATVYFGDNSSNMQHTVYVKVTSDTGAQFDRLVEEYSGGIPPTPSDDSTAPHIYWNRSFPDTASIVTGTNPISLTCFILDDAGLAQVTLNGKEPDLTRNDDGFWQFNTTVTENGVLSVAALDSSGNRTARTYNIDWFNLTVSAGSIATAPALFGEFQYADGTPVGSGYINNGMSAYLSANTSAAVTAKRIDSVIDTTTGATSLETISLTPIENSGGLRFAVTKNSYYQLIATDSGTWRMLILNMDLIDTMQPEASLSETTVAGPDSTEKRALLWSVSKGDTSLSYITEVTINGIPVAITPNRARVSGTEQIFYGGVYTLLAKDGANNLSVPAPYTVEDFAIDLSADNWYSITHSWNQDRNNGSITIDGSKITGGLFDPVLFASGGIYKGDYQYACIPVDEDFAFDEGRARTAILREYSDKYPAAPVMPEADLAAALLQKEAEEHEVWLAAFAGNDAAWKSDVTITGLVPGDYKLFVRDALDKYNTKVISSEVVTINDEAVTFETRITDANLGTGDPGAIKVTASGGRLAQGTYQFAIRPMAKKDEALVDVETMDTNPDVEWKLSDVASGSINSTILNKLSSGWYQVAVRPMGVPQTEMDKLLVLYAEIDSAKARLNKAENANTDLGQKNSVDLLIGDIRIAQQQWGNALDNGLANAAALEAVYKDLIDSNADILNLLGIWRSTEADVLTGLKTRAEADAAKKAYDDSVYAYANTVIKNEAALELANATTALAAAQISYDTAEAVLINAANQAYTDMPELWDNACTGAVFVSYYYPTVNTPAINPYELDYSQEGKVIVSLTKEKYLLAQETTNRLIDDNITKTIIITGNGLYVVIPVKTLSSGDDIMDMLVSADDISNTSGNVVRYRDANGDAHIVVFSIVTSDIVYYIASHPGRYEIYNNSRNFSDTRNHWAKEYISFVAAHGLFSGTGLSVFEPDTPMTRGMFVTVLGRLTEIDPSKYIGKTFDDIETGAWYSAYVKWASETGIVSGYGNNLFGPKDNITREQMCVMLIKCMEYKGIALPEVNKASVFDDVSNISSWAKDEVLLCQKYGLIEGIGNNLFDPQGLATRAQVATIFKRFIEKVSIGG